MLKVRSGYGPQVKRQFVPGIYLDPQIPEAAFGGGIGRALSSLGAAIQAKQETNRKNDEDYTIKKTILDATTEATFGLRDDQIAAPPGAPGFTEAQMEKYKQKHAGIIEGLRGQISDAGLQTIELGLGDLELKVGGNASEFQTKAHTAKVISDAEETRGNLASFSEANHGEYPITIEAWRQFVDSLPEIDSTTRDTIYQSGEDMITAAAAKGKAENDPDGTIELLDGHKPLPNFFDMESRTQMKGVSAPIHNLVSVAQKYMPPGWSFQVGDRTHGKGGVGGARTREQQAEIVARGDSKTMNSKHLEEFGAAVDLTPYKDGKPVEDKYAFGIVALAMKHASEETGIDMTWGGDWKSFQDSYHYEIDPDDIPDVTGNSFVRAMRKGIFASESGHDSTPYDAMGPVVKGDQAHGKYQVMGNNIASWTKLALGDPMTRDEFLASPAAQEAVFEDQMARLYAKYGNVRDAASVWFTGIPYKQAVAEGRDDGHWTVQQYVANVERVIMEQGGEVGDPILDNLSVEKRAATRKLAEATRDNVNTQQIEAFELALLNNEIANPREVYQTMFNSGLIQRPEDSRRLLGTIDAMEKDQSDRNYFNDLMSGTASGVDPTSADFKNALNEGGKPLLSAIEAKDNTVMPALVGIGIKTQGLPENAMGKLALMMNSGDGANALYAARMLSGLADAEGNPLSGLGKGIVDRALTDGQVKALTAFRAVKGVLSEEALIEHLRPKSIDETAVIEKYVAKEADYFEDLDDADLAADFDTVIGWNDAYEQMSSDRTLAGFIAEYKTLFHDFHVRTGTLEGAKASAIAQMAKDWGYDGLTSKFMKYPPTSEKFSRFFPKYKGEQTWMLDQAKEDMKKWGFEEGDTLSFVADETTHREALSNLKPSYLVTILKANGDRVPVIQDRQEFELSADKAQEEAISLAKENVEAREEAKRKLTGKTRTGAPMSQPFDPKSFEDEGLTKEQLSLMDELSDPKTSPDRKIAITKQLREEKIGEEAGKKMGEDAVGSSVYDWFIKNFGSQGTGSGNRQGGEILTPGSKDDPTSSEGMDALVGMFNSGTLTGTQLQNELKKQGYSARIPRRNTGIEIFDIKSGKKVYDERSEILTPGPDDVPVSDVNPVTMEALDADRHFREKMGEKGFFGEGGTADEWSKKAQGGVQKAVDFVGGLVNSEDERPIRESSVPPAPSGKAKKAEAKLTPADKKRLMSEKMAGINQFLKKAFGQAASAEVPRGMEEPPTATSKDLISARGQLAIERREKLLAVVAQNLSGKKHFGMFETKEDADAFADKLDAARSSAWVKAVADDPKHLPSGPQAAQTYKVKRGDTLSAIAKKFGIKDWKTLAKANGVKNPKRLQIGHVLIIPEGKE